MLRRFGPDRMWSPSHLETYANCGFRFYGEQVLKLSPTPDLALADDVARRGTLLHETLAGLYGQLAALAPGEPLPPEEVASRYQETLDALAHSRPRTGLDRAMREIERRQIAAWAEQFAEQHRQYAAAWDGLDEPLRPTHFEVRFGPRRRRSESADGALSTTDPFEVAVDGEPIRFTGQIDRIDVGRVAGRTVFNVIDYKTGARVRLDHNEIRAGRQIQLPLYVMAVADLLLKDLGAAPLAAGYWSIRGKGFVVGGRSAGPLVLHEATGGALKPAANWPALRNDLLQRIKQMVGAIRSGWFPVYSDDPHCGRYCPFSTACRISHVRSLEKQWSPPREGEATAQPPGEPGETRSSA
jgi:RecB family exonuclease